MDASKPIPVSLKKFIRICVEDILPEHAKRKWFTIVERFNVITPKTVIGKNGPVETVLIHKVIDGNHYYDIPLKRDLTEREVKNITEQWDNYYEQKDFIIEASHGDIDKQKKLLADAIIIKKDEYENLCEAIAKTQHSIWMNDRVKKGWRFGEKMSLKEKTHPMLKSWNDLPEQYRKVDVDTPQVFVEELKRMGYTLVKSSELNTLLEDIDKE